VAASSDGERVFILVERKIFVYSTMEKKNAFPIIRISEVQIGLR